MQAGSAKLRNEADFRECSCSRASSAIEANARRGALGLIQLSMTSRRLMLVAVEHSGTAGTHGSPPSPLFSNRLPLTSALWLRSTHAMAIAGLGYPDGWKQALLFEAPLCPPPPMTTASAWCCLYSSPCISFCCHIWMTETRMSRKPWAASEICWARAMRTAPDGLRLVHERTPQAAGCGAECDSSYSQGRVSAVE